MTKEKGYMEEKAPLTDTFFEVLFMPFLETIRSKRTKDTYKMHIIAVCTFFYHYRGIRFSFEQLDATDAKYYFHKHLTKLCEQGAVSYDNCRLRLSACKSFAKYLEKCLPAVQKDGLYETVSPYVSPFEHLFYQGRESVRVTNVLSDKDIDDILSKLERFDTRLFVITLLSFRMYLTQDVILSLEKKHFTFVEDHGRMIGILSYLWKRKSMTKRIPWDIVNDVHSYVDACEDGPVFKNMRGNQMTPSNLTDLMHKFKADCGKEFTLSDFRKKGLMELVAHNPEMLDEIALYSGLSRKMLEEYGKAFDRIAPECVADKSSYKILQKEERK